MRGYTLLCAIVTPLLLATAAPGVVITNLGTLPNATTTAPEDINDAGTIVGTSYYPDPTQPFFFLVSGAFRYTSGSGIQAITTMSGPSPNTAYAVNQSGVIAGTSNGQAFTYSGGGPQQTLPYVRAYGINDGGVTVGTSTGSDTTGHAIIYPPGGPAQDLGTGGGTGASPRAINNNGVVVGFVTFSNGSTRGFSYSVPAGLQLLPSTHLRASDINDSGVIVGVINSGSGGFRDLNGVTTPLSTFDSHTVVPLAISNSGYALGYADLDNTLAGVNDHAVMWSPGNVITDLDAWLDQTSPAEGANWTLVAVNGMNASGQIIGAGTYNDGPGGLSDGDRGFVLDASSLVPEPGSAWLLLPGLSSVFSRRAFQTKARPRDS